MFGKTSYAELQYNLILKYIYISKAVCKMK